MLEADLAIIFASLDASRVRYLVVGGLAVVAHGHARGTADLDLVVALDDENAAAAIRTFTGLGYRPLAHVEPISFASADARRVWAEEKQMRVFQLVSDQHSSTSIYIFVTQPFDFDLEYRRAPRMELVSGRLVPIVSLETLLAMKREAARPRDLDDIANLEMVHRRPPPAGRDGTAS